MKKDDSGKKLINNSFFLMADWLQATVLSLIFWFMVSRLFTPAEYGIASTTVNVSLLVAAFGVLGINTVVANLIPRYIKQGKMGSVVGLIRFSMRFVLAVSVAGSAFFAVFSYQIADVINLPVEMIWLASAMIYAWTFWFLTNGFFQGLQNMKLYFKSSLAGQIVKVLLPVAFFFVGMGIAGPVVAFLVSMLVIVFLRLPHLPRGKPANVNGREVLLKMGVPILIASVMWLIFTNLPNVILNSITSPDVTGIFALALTIVTPLVFIPMTLSQALFPVTSGLSATSNPKRRQSELIALTIRFAAWITVPLIAMLFVFSDEIILLFSGKAANLPASDLMTLVAPAATLLGIGQILVSSIFAIGKVNVTRNLTIVATAMFIGLSVILTLMMSSTGMAIAYLASMLVLVALSYLYLRKEVGLAIHWGSIAKIFIATVIFAAIISTASGMFQSTLTKLASLLAAGAVYLLVLVPMGYYSKDDLNLLSYVMSRSPAMRRRLAFVERFLSKHSH